MIPLLVGNAQLAKQASDLLLQQWNIYVQPVNFPTVPRGSERLRIAPTPGHTEDFQTKLVTALDCVWKELGLKRRSDWAKEGGFLGVGDPIAEGVKPLWTEEQLRLAKNVGQQCVTLW